MYALYVCIHIYVLFVWHKDSEKEMRNVNTRSIYLRDTLRHLWEDKIEPNIFSFFYILFFKKSSRGTVK